MVGASYKRTRLFWLAPVPCARAAVKLKRSEAQSRREPRFQDHILNLSGISSNDIRGSWLMNWNKLTTTSLQNISHFFCFIPWASLSPLAQKTAWAESHREALRVCGQRTNGNRFTGLNERTWWNALEQSVWSSFVALGWHFLSNISLMRLTNIHGHFPWGQSCQ